MSNQTHAAPPGTAGVPPAASDATVLPADVTAIPDHDLLDRALIVGVAGSGTMGAGIAQVAAWAGHRVVLYDVAPDIVQRGLDGVARLLRRGAERGKHAPAASRWVPSS